MNNDKDSLRKIADILDKIKILLDENGALLGECTIHSEFPYDILYKANIDIKLRS